MANNPKYKNQVCNGVEMMITNRNNFNSVNTGIAVISLISKFHSDKFEIIAGERRWLAAQKAGLHKVPVVILNLSDNQTLEVAIVENIQRENLYVVEELSLIHI